MICKKDLESIGGKEIVLTVQCMELNRGSAFEIMRWLKGEGLDSSADLVTCKHGDVVTRLIWWDKTHTNRMEARAGDSIIQVESGLFITLSRGDAEAC